MALRNTHKREREEGASPSPTIFDKYPVCVSAQVHLRSAHADQVSPTVASREPNGSGAAVDAARKLSEELCS